MAWLLIIYYTFRYLAMQVSDSVKLIDIFREKWYSVRKRTTVSV